MAGIKLTPAQDKAIRALHADGVFPKGTRAATIEGIRSAGLIVQPENDGTWDLNPDGRAYLGLPALPNTSTTDEILAELNTNPWNADLPEKPMADWERELIECDSNAERLNRQRVAFESLRSTLDEDEKPFVVQELKPFVGWVTLPETRAHTWGTANVRRNRMAAQGRTVRVHNMINDQVWV